LIDATVAAGGGVALGDRALRPPPLLTSRSVRTRAVQPGTPLERISIEISRRCNLRCIYCYADASPERAEGLSDAELGAVIGEAAALGARLVSIVGGGEPLLRESLLADDASCIDQANARGCYCTLYTNGTLVDARAARWLFARDVSVVGKLNSLDDAAQDELCALPGSAGRIRRGIDALLAAGLAHASPSRLGLETIICQRNYDEIPELWCWMRDRNIVPEVEIPTAQGRAKLNGKSLYFPPKEAPQRYRELFEELLRIDQQRYGFDWIPHPPFVAQSCQLYHTNCYVNDRGAVQPCAGVDREYGQLRVGSRRAEGRPLAAIVRSDAFRKLRHVEQHLAAPCRDCELLHCCYGCRGAAWNLTGDEFAADPVCWRRPRPTPRQG
jgi:radical SAM protein with 4Fe4S-binding SPASM domain